MFNLFFQRIVVILLCTGMLAGCSSSSNSFDYVYETASAGNVTELRDLVRDGYSLDVPNKNGETPLCYAQRNGDDLAFQTLRAAGAAKNARCRIIKTGSTSSLPPDYAYGLDNSDLILYTPDHNPPQEKYPTPTNNSVITGTILAIAGIVSAVLLVIWLS